MRRFLSFSAPLYRHLLPQQRAQRRGGLFLEYSRDPLGDPLGVLKTLLIVLDRGLRGRGARGRCISQTIAGSIHSIVVSLKIFGDDSSYCRDADQGINRSTAHLSSGFLLILSSPACPASRAFSPGSPNRTGWWSTDVVVCSENLGLIRIGSTWKFPFTLTFSLLDQTLVRPLLGEEETDRKRRERESLLLCDTGKAGQGTSDRPDMRAASLKPRCSKERQTRVVEREKNKGLLSWSTNRSCLPFQPSKRLSWPTLLASYMHLF